jgi:hypothetical protein
MHILWYYFILTAYDDELGIWMCNKCSLKKTLMFVCKMNWNICRGIQWLYKILSKNVNLVGLWNKAIFVYITFSKLGNSTFVFHGNFIRKWSRSTEIFRKIFVNKYALVENCSRKIYGIYCNTLIAYNHYVCYEWEQQWKHMCGSIWY